MPKNDTTQTDAVQTGTEARNETKQKATATTTATATTDPVVDLAPVPSVDQHAGKGGRYRIDPKTGKRVLVSRTKGCCGD